MTLINNLFLYYNLKATFLQNYIVHSDNTYTDMSGSSVASVPDSATVIKYDAIAFIKDSNEIWTHGIFYASTDPEILQRISNVEGKVTTLEGIDHTQYAKKSEYLVKTLGVTQASNHTAIVINGTDELEIPNARQISGGYQGGLMTKEDKQKLDNLPNSLPSNLVTSTDLLTYATKSWVNDQGFLKDSDIPGSPDLTSYLKKSEAESLYLPKEDFEWYEEE